MSNTFSKFDLTDKTVLITGGATGLGLHMTRALASLGATVMIAARREKILIDVAQSLGQEKLAGKVLQHPVDLASRASIRALVDHCNKTMGGVDVFIGNAGIDIFEKIEAIQDDSIDQLLQVNLSANVELMRAFVPRMRERGWGRILFSSSVSSVQSTAQEGMAVYAGTKAALNAIARTAAAEAGRSGVTVNCLIFGLFATPMMREQLELLEKTQSAAVAKDFVDSLSASTALGRVGQCEELEGAIQLLASNAGSYITGTTITIDGGMTMMLRPNPMVPVV